MDDDDDGRTDDGRTPDHGHPISSPCEPNGSGELKNQRTNGPVNAHLSLLHIPINMFEYYGFNPSAGADEALGPFSFFRIINILSICQFLAGFSLQTTF